MSYRANVYKVMIASPGDVAKERETIRQVVHQWNDLYSSDKKIVLLPVGWETHSAPEMGGRVQEIINKRVLKECDLMVGTFWTRIGTQTGNSASGTVEEIEEHIALGKPAMIYFSSVPVQLDSVEPEQYAKLKDFKKECEGKGLIESYDSISEFRDKFFRQLTMIILQNEYFDAEPNDRDIPKVEEDPLQRLNLSKEGKTLLVEASESKDGSIMKLAVYGGPKIETNSKQFIEQGNPRSRAAWESAINELVSLGLLEEKGHKGEIFKVTHEGYFIAERLRVEL